MTVIMESNYEAAVEEVVFLGKYPVDNNDESLMPIRWTVINRVDNKALLISTFGIDTEPFNKNFSEVTWKGSTLQSWLNTEFYERTFNEQEK